MKRYWLAFPAGMAVVWALIAQTDNSWPMAGHDVLNTRSQPGETAIGPSNVGSLKSRWAFKSGGDLSATPAVVGDAIFFPDWTGSLYSVQKTNGKLIWVHRISEYDGVQGSLSRVTPALYQDNLILGDQLTPDRKVHNGTNVFSVNRLTGVLNWITQVDTQGAAQITGSPVIMGDVVYVGVSSNEEALATDDSYPCCTFRGSMVALNAATGKILWKTYTVPDNHGQLAGYSGGAIWQPPAIDAQRGLLFVGTGNNYTVPPDVLLCQEEFPSGTCTEPDDYYDSAVAFNLTTGKIQWSHRLEGADTWTVACKSQPIGKNCELPSSPDYDFSGSGPNRVGNIIGFGQKSGVYWALNPDNGAIVWTAMVGPGSTLGGLEWGTATDGSRIYAAITNGDKLPYKLMNGQTITWGAWSAIDVNNGDILWQTPDPVAGGLALGAVTVANGVVYAGSSNGHMYGMDSGSGKILFDFPSRGTVVDSPAIADGIVFWGSGYSHIMGFTGNNEMIAFSLP